MEHVVIPRERYEKLLARMTQPAKTIEEKKKSQDGGSCDGPSNPPSKRITPTPVAKTQTADTLFDNNSDTKTPENRGGLRETSDSTAESPSTTEPLKNRTLEEIQSNHSAFLPPGDRPDTLNDNAGQSGRMKTKMKPYKKRKDELNTKSSVKHRRNSKPYATLKKKWITLS